MSHYDISQHKKVKEAKVVRFGKKELQARVEFITDKEACQICDHSYDLDYPHHVEQGLGVKDDRYLINTCVACHRLIHTQGYSAVKKSRGECKAIAWQNHLEAEDTL